MAPRRIDGGVIGRPCGEGRCEVPGYLACAWLSPCSTRQASALVRCKSSKAKEAIETVCNKACAVFIVQVQMVSAGQHHLLEG